MRLPCVKPKPSKIGETPTGLPRPEILANAELRKSAYAIVPDKVKSSQTSLRAESLTHRLFGTTIKNVRNFEVAEITYMTNQTDQLVKFKAEFFKALASPLRIRILDQLRDGELSVTELRLRLSVEPTNISQQLAILRSKNIIVGRKQGSNIYYSCRDPAIFKFLDAAREIFNNHLIDIKDMLEAL
jgi:ArsR family transcriptional regulator